MKRDLIHVRVHGPQKTKLKNWVAKSKHRTITSLIYMLILERTGIDLGKKRVDIGEEGEYY